jgi:hypothetical protein
MEKALVALAAVAVVFMVVVIAVAYWLGYVHAVEKMSFRQISPAQAANAMQQDDFYSNYNGNTLIIPGTVAAVSHSNNAYIVEFKTNTSFKARCEFDGAKPAVAPVSKITVLTEGGAAERQSSGVLLKDCILK